jgi:DNA-binding NarL/FixJ family response regulator
VTHLVLQGETTTGIAGRLFVSPQTVQQHLKAIFDKTGGCGADANWPARRRR